MKQYISGLSTLAIGILASQAASASITLMDKDDWKVSFYGFAQSDFLHDSTRSLNEVVGNSPVARVNTTDGDNGRTIFSVRNSRFGFIVNAPKTGDLASKSVLEMDFLGNSNPVNGAEGTAYGAYANPALRLRHYYIQLEEAGWQLTIGHTWNLFGWQPTYFLSTDSVPPVSGEMYQRSQQLTLIKNLDLNDEHRLSAGVSIVRPVQRDAEIPGLDAGVRWSWSGRKAALSAYNQGETLQPMSIGLSGRLNEFSYMSGAAADTTTRTSLLGSAIAVDGLIPILASSSEQDPGNTLVLSGEFTTGKGYGEAFPNWTGGLSAFSGAAVAPTGAGGIPAAGTDLDAGELGLDPALGPTLVHLQSWNAQLQYHFPTEWHTFTTVGYGQLWSDNVDSMTVGASAAKLYNRSQTYFVNVFHDFTKQVRMGLEWDQFRTTYSSDAATAINNRVVASAFFLF